MHLDLPKIIYSAPWVMQLDLSRMFMYTASVMFDFYCREGLILLHPDLSRSNLIAS